MNFSLRETELGNRWRQLALISVATVALFATPLRAQTTAPVTPPAGTAQPGIRAVDPTTLRMTFYTVQPANMLASRLIGLDVHNLQNEEIGEIEDLIMDDGKTIRGIVIDVGGFLGIGERRTVIEPGSIVITRETGGSLKAVVNTTREDLRKAPEFKFEGNVSRR
jgi:sporulation protein YlmC with PRC-barrel domain